VVEASISDLRAALEEGRTTSRAITTQYLARLERYNSVLHAAITINPDALKDADARDAERRQRRRRGPLHGIPVAVKDNIQAVGMPTTGGALAFRRWHAPYDATLVRRLRDAGAILIAKTTMTELANWVAFGMPAGYNAVLGYSVNPYDLRRVLQNGVEVPRHLPGGSSSGIGTAASLWAASVGTETSGSILSPAGENMLVGVKPTVGRISRHGVIPISADQDTPGFTPRAAPRVPPDTISELPSPSASTSTRACELLSLVSITVRGQTPFSASWYTTTWLP
jgi:amidase